MCFCIKSLLYLLGCWGTRFLKKLLKILQPWYKMTCYISFHTWRFCEKVQQKRWYPESLPLHIKKNHLHKQEYTLQNLVHQIPDLYFKEDRKHHTYITRNILSFCFSFRTITFEKPASQNNRLLVFWFITEVRTDEMSWAWVELVSLQWAAGSFPLSCWDSPRTYCSLQATW